MTEPTDPSRRLEGAPLPAPVDPYAQHPPHDPGYGQPPPAYPQSAYPESPYPQSPYPQTPYPPTYQQPVYPQPAYDPQVPPGYPPVQYVHPAYDPVSGLPWSDKSRVTAGVLSILLGAFGAGRFYTGHIGIAIAQIAVTWLTCGVGHLWPLIDGIIVLAQGGTDSEGRALRR